VSEYQPASPPRLWFKDKFLLVGTALLVCVIGVGSLQFANAYKIDQKWILFAFFMIGFVPIVWRRYKSYTPGIPVTSFFAIWMVLHGVLSTMVAISVPLIYWLPIYAVEFGIGFFIAATLFEKAKPEV
jgi:hypothetical protein